MAVNVAIVDAFTRAAGEGNRAGVVLDPSSLDAPAMQSIARAVAASETAFVTIAPGEALQFRYFTPKTELPFCGHATVASLHLLAERGRLQPGPVTFECTAGRFQAEIEAAAEGWRVWLETPQHPWTESPLIPERVAWLLDVAPDALDPTLPIEVCGPKLFAPFAAREALWAVRPRFDEIAATGLSFFCFTRETLEAGNVAHGRYFAPVLGVREDPATGAANGPLAAYLFRHGVLKAPSVGEVIRARSEQGDAMGKPGRVELEVTIGASPRVRVGGVAVTVLTGELKPGR